MAEWSKASALKADILFNIMGSNPIFSIGYLKHLHPFFKVSSLYFLIFLCHSKKKFLFDQELIFLL